MNEKLKDLARLAQNATAAHFGDRWSSIGRAEFMMIYNQKFAELIVRECADITNSIGEHGHIASDEMKEYFGVK